jgi:FkbM family methyltransferase
MKHNNIEAIGKFLRSLPRFRGKYRFSRLLLGDLLHSTDFLLKINNETQYLLPNFLEPIAFALLVDGVYEPECIKLMLSLLAQDSLFLDIGANIGAFSIPAAKQLKKLNGKVIAVEASPTIFPYLRKNIEINNLENIELLSLAVTNSDHNSVDFYEAPTEKFGMGSISPQFQSTPIRVKTITIDSILNDQELAKVSFIKVDVEGYEAEVFEGASGLFNSPNPPMVLFEFCDWAEARKPKGKIGDSQRTLMDFGYKIWRLEEYGKANLPLDKPLVVGCEMLVGVKSDY